MLLGSKTHTQGDTRRWTVSYDRWLANTATVKSCTVTSSSTTCTIGTPAPTVLGNDVVFFLTGGSLNEQLTVSLAMTDSFSNVKHDTISFVCVAP